MAFELRVVILVLAAYAWASVAGAWLAAVLWRRMRSADATERADLLLRLRLLPGATGLATAALASMALWRFEPRGADESIGVLFTLAAAGGGLLALTALTRAGRLVWRTRQAIRAWEGAGLRVPLPGISAPALVVQSDFPIVAVVGWLRPRLILAQSVLDACSPEELEAILAHEQRHIDRRDNLKRLVFGSAPDVLAWLPLGRVVQADWHEATEDAADDGAATLGQRGRPLLAQALLRVARLVPPGQRVGLPASTLYRGGSLDRRVRRLMDPRPLPAGRMPWRIKALGATVLAAALWTLESLHELAEVAVAVLP